MNPPDGTTRPIWTYAATPSPTLPTVGAHVEVAVLGAGIAGVTAAYLFAREGRDVALIDEHGVGAGQTARTSAHLASVCDDRFSHLEHLLGRDAARTFYESHASAIDRIESIVNAEKIDCDFTRLDAFLFPAPGDEKTIQQEFEAAARIDFPGVERVDSVPSISAASDAIRWPRQARFEPVKYLNALAASARRDGVALLVGKRVTDATGSINGQPCKITFADGSTMTADSVVVATNTPSPINDWLGVYTKQAAYRTYMVGLEVADGAVADALYWDTLDPYHYVRLHKADGKTVLLVGGEDHKTGQAGAASARFDALETWARQTFDGVGERVIEWSGQVNEPGDGVAFIGKAPTKGDRVYVITGDSGMGLTHGTLGAMLVTDLIAGRPNAWASLYDPNRKQTNTEFVKEQANVAKQYVDLVTPGEVSSESEVPAGSGAVMRSGLSKVAIYKDEQGVVTKCSAVCTHLQCIVHWNGVEKSWDCPCHGSRFDPRGKVLIGPAIDDLPPVE